MRAEDLPIQRAPFVKGKSFNPMPIVTDGIPDYADSSKNPKCIGTPEYEQFWAEQLYRCVNGYKTGGIFLPGRFYYYMNFNSMLTINGVITPDYCDMHLELCNIIEWCKANQKNLIIGKKRRAGVSEFTQKAVVDYGFRFSEVYQAGVAAGQKKYAEDFMTKWGDSESLLIPELKINTLLNNTEEVVSGYEVTENGKDVEKNNGCKLLVRTMHTNPNMFKGLFLNDAIAEECGEFDNLCEFLAATEDCLVDGDTQVGTFFIYGTGGRIDKGSKDFKTVWENPDEYNCVKYLIAGDRFKKPFYGGATRNGQDISVIPNLLKKYKPYQCIGMEDREAAIEHIKERRKELKKGKIDKYLKYCQNNPLDEHEIFTKSNSNDFNLEKLNQQSINITTAPKKYTRYKLEWVTDGTGNRVVPLKVRAEAIDGNSDDNECVLILDGYHPLPNFQNLYVAGIDPYELDEARSSKSLGGMAVMIRRNKLGGLQMAPVATICCRPKRKEIFFDMCLKLAVYYNIKHNVLGDIMASSGIMKWFKDAGCENFLAVRPTKYESVNSTQTHEYWVRMTPTSRPARSSLMQTWIEDFIDGCWFPDVVYQLSNFDQTTDESDNDLADAIGIALMQDASVPIEARDTTNTNEKNPFVLGGWKYNSKGVLVPENDFERPINPEKDFSGFGR